MEAAQPVVALTTAKPFTKGLMADAIITIAMVIKPMSIAPNATVDMPPRKPYNPNTAYGRRKRREEAQKYYDNLPPEEQREVDEWKMGCMLVIVVVVLLIGYLSGNMMGALKWLSH